MSNILSQQEVDSLLKGVTSGKIETETDVPSDGVATFDFASHDRIIRGRMPTFEIINERFSRIFSTSLSRKLRTVVDIYADSVKMLKFAEFYSTLSLPCDLHIFRMKPLTGHALLILETKLAFRVVELLFGGKGSADVKIERRELTAIENRVIQKIVNACLHDLATAWKPIHELAVHYVRSQINSQLSAIVLPTDVVVVTRFHVELENVTGAMTLCIPYSTIEPIRDKLYAGFQSDQLEVDASWKKRLQERIRETTVDVVVELGVSQITTDRLIALKVGDVIQLQQDVNRCLVTKVEGVPKLKARAGLMRSNKAIKIEQRC